MKHLNQIFISFLLILFCSCQNSDEDNQGKDTSVLQQSDSATLQSKLVLSPEEDSLLSNSDIKTVWPKLKSDALRQDLILQPKIEIIPVDEQDEYDRYISEFKQRYGSDFKGRSDNFQLSIKKLYRNMMSDLGLQKSANASGGYSAIRFYPAISDDGKGNKTMYLVFLGEIVKDAQYGPIRNSLLESNFYGILQKNHDIEFMDDSEKAQAINYDIQRFKKDYGPNLHDTSFYFTVSKFYMALKKIDPKGLLDWGTDTTIISNLNYGLTLYPALRSDTLIFVVKPHKKMSSTSYPIQKGLNYLDHIDPCPDKCPEHKL